MGNVTAHTCVDLPPLLPPVRCGRRLLIGGSRNRRSSSSLCSVCVQPAQGNSVFVEVLCSMNVSFLCQVEDTREPFGSCPTAFLVWVTASRKFHSKLIALLQVRAPIPCVLGMSVPFGRVDHTLWSLMNSSSSSVSGIRSGSAILRTAQVCEQRKVQHAG